MSTVGADLCNSISPVVEGSGDSTPVEESKGPEGSSAVIPNTQTIGE